jgi:DNA-binding LacI/PurR family transcriptional regulator
MSRADALPPRAGTPHCMARGRSAGLGAAQKRLHGWRSALREAHVRVPRVLHGDWSAASGYAQGRKLAARDDVAAIFAANDQMAIGILRAVDAEQAAQRILAELLQMIEGAEPPAGPVTLPGTELIIRRSTGPLGRHRRPRFVTEAS